MNVMTSFVRPSLLLWVPFIATVAKADSVLIQTRPDPANYMIFYDRIRNFRTLQYAADGLREAAVARAKFAEDSYQRTAKLYQTGTISEEAFRIADASRKVSALSIERYASDSAANGAAADANSTLLPYVQGASVSVAAVYTKFKVAWDESCNARSIRINEAKANLKLSEYRLRLTTRLLPTKTVSLEEHELRQLERAQATAEVHASTTLFQTCRDGEPSLEFIESLAQP